MLDRRPVRVGLIAVRTQPAVPGHAAATNQDVGDPAAVVRQPNPEISTGSSEFSQPIPESWARRRRAWRPSAGFQFGRIKRDGDDVAPWARRADAGVIRLRDRSRREYARNVLWR